MTPAQAAQILRKHRHAGGTRWEAMTGLSGRIVWTPGVKALTVEEAVEIARDYERESQAKEAK